MSSPLASISCVTWMHCKWHDGVCSAGKGCWHSTQASQVGQIAGSFGKGRPAWVVVGAALSASMSCGCRKKQHGIKSQVRPCTHSVPVPLSQCSPQTHPRAPGRHHQAVSVEFAAQPLLQLCWQQRLRPRRSGCSGCEACFLLQPDGCGPCQRAKSDAAAPTARHCAVQRRWTGCRGAEEVGPCHRSFHAPQLPGQWPQMHLTVASADAIAMPEPSCVHRLRATSTTKAGHGKAQQQSPVNASSQAHTISHTSYTCSALAVPEDLLGRGPRGDEAR
jgi:hypothetical protein